MMWLLSVAVLIRRSYSNERVSNNNHPIGKLPNIITSMIVLSLPSKQSAARNSSVRFGLPQMCARNGVHLVAMSSKQHALCGHENSSPQHQDHARVRPSEVQNLGTQIGRIYARLARAKKVVATIGWYAPGRLAASHLWKTREFAK